jgi:hypothetical protein
MRLAKEPEAMLLALFVALIDRQEKNDWRPTLLWSPAGRCCMSLRLLQMLPGVVGEDADDAHGHGGGGNP